MLRLRHRAETVARERTGKAGSDRILYRRFLAEELAKRQPQINRLIGKRQRRNRPR